jgi:hypothetical protein
MTDENRMGQEAPPYYAAGSYEQQMLDFTEAVRTMLGAGYGEGHQLPDLLNILRARNRLFLKLTNEEEMELHNRPVPAHRQRFDR